MPQSNGPDEAKIKDQLSKAEKELVRLSTDLTKTHMLLKKEKVTDKRLKEAIKRARSVLSKHVEITKLSSDKAFEELPDDVKAQVSWMEAMVAELTELQDQLAYALKLMKKDPESDFGVILKPVKRLAREVKQAPRHVSLMVKAIKKGVEMEGPYGELFHLIPAYLILFRIGDTVTVHMAKKP